MRAFILAGEASGDVLGAEIIDALRAKYGPSLALSGLGGEAMAAAGLTSIFNMGDVAVMGLVEVLAKYFQLRSRIRTLKEAIEAFEPDVLILIDAQGLSYRIGKHFKDAKFRLIQVVAPTVWAWKPERAAKAATYLDHLACLFPFEPAYFEREGLAATFVGHPALKNEPGIDKARAREALALSPEETWLAVLPGSRAGEVGQLSQPFANMITRAHKLGLISGVLIPVAGPVSKSVKAWASQLPGQVRLLNTPQERALLPAADLALAASGTVSLELSAQGIPAVLAYRFHWLTWALIARQLTNQFMSLTNLLGGREIQPEFKLNRVGEAQMWSALERLLRSPEARAEARVCQLEALKNMRLEDKKSFGQRVTALV